MTSAVQLEADDAFFAGRIEMLPAEMYFRREPTEEELEQSWKSRKFKKNLGHSAPKQGIKESTKKAKKRREKFERTSNPTLEELAAEATTRAGGDEDDDEPIDKQKQLELGLIKKSTPARSIDELRERLRNKLQELRGNRKDPDKSAPARSPKSKKQSRNKAKRQAPPPNAKKVTEKVSEQSSSIEESELQSKVLASLQNYSAGKMSFGVTEGNENKGPRSRTRDPLQKSGTGKRNILNVKKMLKKAEENQALLHELKSSASAEDRELLDKKMWERIEQKACGEKVLDSKMLRKTVKSIEAKKNKSAKAWAARLAAQKEQVDESLSKRQANIENAQKRKVAKKLKRKGIVLESTTETTNEPESGEKRRRKRPGFEGKHSGFLNDSKKTEPRKGGKQKPKSA